MAIPKKKVYLVRETFEWEYGDQPPARKHAAVWAYPDREQAIACRDQLFKTCRHVDPFWYGGRSLGNATSMSEKQFRAYVTSLGLKLPHRDDWRNWWHQHVDNLTEEQLAGLWTALDKVQPYRIEETEADDEGEEPNTPAVPSRKAYVVQRLTWQYNDNWHDLENDEPIKAFRDPELAELHRQELEEPERENWRNPLRAAGPMENATSLSEEQLTARLVELGIEPPPLETVDGSTYRDYFGNDEWWNRLWYTWRRQFVHQVWDLFDRVRFYEVVEIDLDQ